MTTKNRKNGQPRTNPLYFGQNSLSEGSGLPTMKQCCFRANAETRPLNYRVPSWETPSLEQPIAYFHKKFQFFSS